MATFRELYPDAEIRIVEDFDEEEVIYRGERLTAERACEIADELFGGPHRHECGDTSPAISHVT